MLRRGKLRIIYARVSTSSQNISSQIKIGLAKASLMGYQESDIMIIEDNGISSMAITLANRGGIANLQTLIRENKVDVLIVYDRDRIARDMFEYLEIVEDLLRFEVKVVFSNPHAEEFTNDFAREAELSLYDESEGKKIVARTQQASRYYRKAPFGYRKIGEKATTRYEFSSIHEIKLIESLFDEFNSIETKAEYQRLKKRWKDIIPGILENTLTNSYYSGHIFFEDRVEKLQHVEAIVDVELIQRNIEKIKNWGYGKKKDKPTDTFIEQTKIPLLCDACGATLKKRVIKSEIHYSCLHKEIAPKVKAVILPEARIKEVIKQNLIEQVTKIDIEVLRIRCLSDINGVITKLHNKKRKLAYQNFKLASVIRQSRGNLKKLKQHLIEINNLKDQLYQLDQECEQLIKLRDGLSSFTSEVLRNMKNQISFYSIETIRALVCKINVGNNYIKISNRFDEFQKGAS